MPAVPRDTKLPSCLLVTPDIAPEGTVLDAAARRLAIDAFAVRLQRALDDGIRLVQLRNRSLDIVGYRELTEAVLPLVQRARARLVLNPNGDIIDLLLAAKDMPNAPRWLADADGLHLTSKRLLASAYRPAGWRWVSAACHDTAQLAQAARLKLDFVTLSPVLATATHPEANPLGWEAFGELIAVARSASVPVFALGGMTREHLPQAQAAGAAGIAAIRAFWPAD